MALDPRISMLGEVPNLAPNLGAGLKLGYDISQMPRQGREAQLKEQQNVRGDKQSIAMSLYAGFGQDTVTPENYNQFVSVAKEMGLPIEGLTPEKANVALQVGKNLTAAKLQSGTSQRRVQSTENLPNGMTKIVWSDGAVETKMLSPEAQAQLKAQQDANIEYQRSLYSKRSEGSEIGKTEAQLAKADEVAEAEAEKELKKSFAKVQGEFNARFANETKRLDNETKALRALEIAKDDTARASGLIDTAAATDRQIGFVDEAIAALDNGAESGYFANKLPSFRRATLELEQAVKKMGIENINKATFGALSEKELELAMTTDIDLNMDQDELRAFLIDKKEAMQKLADEQRKLARHIRGGGSIDTWKELQKGNQEAEEGRKSITSAKVVSWGDL